MRNNFIIIAHEFPPLNRGGVHRLARFAKYLGTYDIVPTVITVEAETYKNEQIDESILQDPSFEIVRTSIEPKDTEDNYYLSLTDSIGRRWWPYLSHALDEQIEKKKPKAILVTAPPFSMIALSRILSKKYNLPLILDMRDAWTNWNFVPFPSKIHYWLTKKIEKKALESATHALVTSNQTKLELLQTHGRYLLDKITVIHNSYEGQVKALSPLPSASMIKIGYVGSFYYNPISQSLIDDAWWKKKPHQIFQHTPRKENWLYRSPYFVFKTFKYLFDRYPERLSTVKLVFAGKKPTWFTGMVKEFDLEQSVEHLGALSKEDSIRFQQSCNALLLTSSKVLNGRDYSIAGKTFEYFVAGKPILGFVKEGSQKDLLQESGMSLILDPDEVEIAGEQLEKWLRGTLKLEPNYDILEKYSAVSTVRILSEIIRSF